MNEGIVDLAWLFCKRAKEKGLDEEDIKWVKKSLLSGTDQRPGSPYGILPKRCGS